MIMSSFFATILSKLEIKISSPLIMDVSEKINILMNALNLKPKQFADKIGATHQHIGNIRGKARVNPGYDFLLKMFVALEGQINLEWFWYEKGTPLLSNNSHGMNKDTIISKPANSSPDTIISKEELVALVREVNALKQELKTLQQDVKTIKDSKTK